MPRFYGTNGDDQMVGGPEDDEIFGLYGNDLIEAGDGADLIVDNAGSNIIRAGRGDDRIYLRGYPTVYNEATVNLVEAGDGNDYLNVDISYLGALTADLGAGDDIVYLDDVTGRGEPWQCRPELVVGFRFPYPGRRARPVEPRLFRG
ncbi:calcium-binding protein [Sphingobium ummariense]